MIAPREHATIAGKYRLIRQLGQGGMGSVWLAEHLTLCSQVAIKLIHVDMASSAEVLGRFLREAQAAASLRSPHVVQILDHGVDEGTPYIAMELLEGESLADRLVRVGRLEPVAVGRMMTEVGRAMGRAHEAGIVHRDLKPDNVFLVRNDDDEVTKVLDFGIAKAASGPGGLGAAASSATRTGALLGTPYYMSPEQAEGARSLDHRTDIWAMGVIAFECLLGRRPFDAESLGGLLLAICTRPIPIPSQCGPVPSGFDAWFARVCNRDPAQRFASARDAASELKRLCDGNTAASGAQWADNSAVSSGLRAADASSGVAAVSGALMASGSAVSNQSFAGLSATQLEAAGVPKRAGNRGRFLLLGGVALMIGGALLAWAHFKSNAPALATSAANLAPLPSSSGAARAAESARSDELAVSAPASSTLAARPAEQSPESVSAPVRAPIREPARPSTGVRGTAKQTPPATVATPPARAAASAPVVRPAARPAVNLGI